MRFFCNQNLMNKRISEEFRRITLVSQLPLDQIPYQTVYARNALIRAGKITAYIAANKRSAISEMSPEEVGVKFGKVESEQQHS